MVSKTKSKKKKEVVVSKKKITRELKVKKTSLNIKKFKQNPIIKPNIKNNWESKATFNPGAIEKDGKVHLLYRAIGDDDVSALGYALSNDGVNIHERLPQPIFFQKSDRKNNSVVYQIPYSSGGGWNGGCEDPRLTIIDGVVYMLYTAFDGWGSLRIALTSIGLSDFVNKQWRWKKPVLISPPWEIHKNWVIFPEKIKGQFAILHSISPKILISYFDNLNEFEDDDFIKTHYSRIIRKRGWDNWIRGAAAPPIKTDYGWLLLYHAISNRDPNKYKLGAMILDKKDPTKILYRSKQPLLEPKEYYENEGFKAGVVYCCGAVVKDKKLFIYYGGADKVTCVATVDLDDFLKKICLS